MSFDPFDDPLAGKLSRRSLFAASMLVGPRRPSPTPARRKLERVGLQLYTVRDRMVVDVGATLARVAEIGYREVEFAGYFDRSAEELRDLLDDLGLTAVAAHVSLEEMRDDAAGQIAAARTLGMRYVIVPWIEEADRQTLADYEAIADELNQLGERCREASLRFGYHNHAFEFEVPPGQATERVPYEVLLERTDPELVTMELDLFWVVKGDREPLDLLARHPGRFSLCHVKDMDAAGAMVDVGAGQIDFAEIFRAAEQGGLEHYFVEHDEPDDSFASVAASYAYLDDLEIS